MSIEEFRESLGGVELGYAGEDGVEHGIDVKFMDVLLGIIAASVLWAIAA